MALPLENGFKVSPPESGDWFAIHLSHRWAIGGGEASFGSFLIAQSVRVRKTKGKGVRCEEEFHPRAQRN